MPTNANTEAILEFNRKSMLVQPEHDRTKDKESKAFSKVGSVQLPFMIINIIIIIWVVFLCLEFSYVGFVAKETLDRSPRRLDIDVYYSSC